jgi:hypothetical protein
MARKETVKELVDLLNQSLADEQGAEQKLPVMVWPYSPPDSSSLAQLSSF